MQQVVQIQFADKMVTYDQFVSDVAARLVSHIRIQEADPRFMTQAKAFKVFGRANVERWRRKGDITPCIRPGKLEYETAKLRDLQRREQDYL